MAFIADNVIFIMSTVLVAGLVFLGQQAHRGSPVAATQASPRAATAPAPMGTAASGAEQGSQGTTSTTPASAPVQTVAPPAIRRGGDDGGFDD